MKNKRKILVSFIVILLVVIGYIFIKQYNNTQEYFHDVKYFYDNTPFPNPGEPMSGYHNQATIRGKLTATKFSTNCSIAPCSGENIVYYLTDIKNDNYKIMIRGSWDANPIITNLKLSEVYVVSGSLEHSYDSKNKLGFVFDAEKIEK